MNQQLIALKQWLMGERGLAEVPGLKDLISRAGRFIRPALLILMGSYMCAALVHVLLVALLASQISVVRASVDHSSADLSREPFNYFKFNTAVLKRHLFNSSGEFPHDQNSPKKQKMVGGDCKASALNLKLVGTIMNDNPRMSVATVIDQSMKVTDVYKQGDRIIDQRAVITQIEKGRLVLDVAGSRECLEISSTGRVDRQTYKSSVAKTSAPKSFDLASSHSNLASGVVMLKDSYVEEQLGEGFVNIIQSSRFVPSLDENGQAQGFKIFGIKPKTLFQKIGLKDDDIIHQVNQTSLKNVEQGFALYQALQDEREVVIGVIRKGEPLTVKVQIEE